MTLQPQSIVVKQTEPLLPPSPFADGSLITDHRLTGDNQEKPDARNLNMLRGADLPGDDGEPMENEREDFQIHLGLDSLNQYWQDRDDFYTGGNMFVYYSISQAQAVLKELNPPERNRDIVRRPGNEYAFKELEHPERPKRAFRGPDMFVVLNVDGSYRRQKWVVWEEKGRHPDVIFEFLSPSTRKTDLGLKKRIYERTFKTHEYYCFDYLNPTGEDSLFGWRLNRRGVYLPIAADSQGRLWSEKLELSIGRWSGCYNRDNTVWMRFYQPDGELVLTFAEAAQQHAEQETRLAEQETRRAEQADKRAQRLAAQLRAMGVEPDLI